MESQLTEIPGTRHRRGGTEKTRPKSWATYQCSCGATKDIRCDHVKSGQTRTCGGTVHRLRVGPPQDSRLTPVEGTIRYQQDYTQKVPWALYRCECGNEKWIRIASVNSGSTRSCGCLHREAAGRIHEGVVTHGITKDFGKRVNAWVNTIWHRCNNPKDMHFERYGAAGIEMRMEKRELVEYCNQLAKDQGFKGINDALDQNYSIDRIDPFGNYDRGNLRWADASTQATNTRRGLS